MKYFQEEIETMPQEQIRALQSKHLCEQVQFVYKNVAPYKKKMDDIGLAPEDIKGIEDLPKLPFVTKDDLREHYPAGYCGVPMSDCVHITASSGTTGKSVIGFYTKEDVDMISDCGARALVAAGGTKDDIFHLCFGYGLFTGGFCYDAGAHRLGCLTLPMSAGNTQRQLQFMVDLKATMICCTPSYAANLGEAIAEAGLRDKIKLKSGLFGAEPWTKEMRQKIEALLGIKAHNVYGLTEISGATAFDCEEQEGLHINEDHFIAEIIDPHTLKVLPEGETGELVISSISKKGFPLLRYRTRDLSSLSYKPCSCGRTFVRMHRPTGRIDDMMVVKGVNVWPSQIETVLINKGFEAHYQIVVDRIGFTDTIEVQVEKTSAMANDIYFNTASKEKSVIAGLKSMLGIRVDVKIVEPKTISRGEGIKIRRIIDKRNLFV